ncbi:hypothetical protein DFH11DRAFT_1744778 [Phellopilus nigrolimitatus]|nr:hypothetical protein DFH11DRAFT_1744778 [Phellopilus nigrolimitatus]
MESFCDEAFPSYIVACRSSSSQLSNEFNVALTEESRLGNYRVVRELQPHISSSRRTIMAPRTPWTHTSLPSDKIKSHPNPSAPAKNKRKAKDAQARLLLPRTYALAPYPPLCAHCGLVICVLNPPHNACRTVQHHSSRSSRRLLTLHSSKRSAANWSRCSRGRRQTRSALGRRCARPSGDAKGGTHSVTIAEAPKASQAHKVLSLNAKTKLVTVVSYTPAPPPAVPLLSQADGGDSVTVAEDASPARVLSTGPDVRNARWKPDAACPWTDVREDGFVRTLTYVRDPRINREELKEDRRARKAKKAMDGTEGDAATEYTIIIIYMNEINENVSESNKRSGGGECLEQVLCIENAGALTSLRLLQRVCVLDPAACPQAVRLHEARRDQQYLARGEDARQHDHKRRPAHLTHVHEPEQVHREAFWQRRAAPRATSVGPRAPASAVAPAPARVATRRAVTTTSAAGIATAPSRPTTARHKKSCLQSIHVGTYSMSSESHRYLFWFCRHVFEGLHIDHCVPWQCTCSQNVNMEPQEVTNAHLYALAEACTLSEGRADTKRALNSLPPSVLFLAFSNELDELW